MTKDARRTEPAGTTEGSQDAEDNRTSAPDTRSHLPWSFSGRQAKGS